MNHCLLVDDSKVALMELKFTIRHFYPKCEFFMTQSPREGLEIARSHHQVLDCVIVDYNMEEMNGFELVQELSSFIAPCKIAVCSGNIQKTVQEKIISLGASFIEKRINDDKFQKFNEIAKSGN